MTDTLFTIGHSTRTLDEFVALLHGSDIRRVVDVRKLPGSTRYPWFNADTLAAALADTGIAFERNEPLTGRRPVSKTVPFEVNAWWQNRSFHNYADHALSPEFARGLDDAIAQAAHGSLALMCSEAVWWRCHRRIIADYVLARGGAVQHIMGERNLEAARLSEGAVVGDTGVITYPA
ncbi:DUF488 family protein [Microbacterium sp. NC79]|uniref:DUF488 domain-containing protein n=1 Tax=Microbacterium sp. NC79 TaxID=2851009 RepID=UPI001C2BCDD0|nr:DUF488 domain-containing protein [Microbacterium sp. NC79]MBV0895983.1 DUF488 domain-containing protein [Microbacterium sp. NC79]